MSRNALDEDSDFRWLIVLNYKTFSGYVMYRQKDPQSNQAAAPVHPTDCPRKGSCTSGIRDKDGTQSRRKRNGPNRKDVF